VIHGYLVERNRLLAARSIQPTIPLAGTNPAKGNQRLCRCLLHLCVAAAVAVIRIGNSWAHLGLALVQIGAGVRLPFGCAAPVIIVLSLLLWAILLILLLRLLHDITGARGDMKRPA
jgi:hypothetical protein